MRGREGGEEVRDEILKNQERLLRKVIAALDEHIALMTKYATPTTLGNPPTLSEADAEKYELTGEYREPRLGDSFVANNPSQYVIENLSSRNLIGHGPRWIVRERPKPPIPTPPPLRPEDAKWFEYTGEYRLVGRGELYVENDQVTVCRRDFQHLSAHILRFKYAKEEFHE